MTLAPLPRGITGFVDPGGALPATDPGRFATACHEAARDARTSVCMLDNDGRAVSYFAAVFDMEGEPIAALCNRVYPLVGLLPAATLSDPGGAFLHHAVLEHAFARWDEFHLLDADLLNAELRPEMLEALAPGELSQVRYWKPVRVGDVIYNSWD